MKQADLIARMHAEGHTIVETIKAVRKEFDLSLGEAKSQVSNHPAWAKVVKAAQPLHDALQNLADRGAFNASSLAEMEIRRIPWSTLRQAGGTAEQVPHALMDLLSAPTPELATNAYWRLENHVVVQGQLHQAAEPVVSVLVAALMEDQPRHVRLGVLELLFQILAGSAHESEIALGNEGIDNACRHRAREGMWLLYKELMHGERDAAREVIELIEPDSARFNAFSASSSA
ncbi:hypothetical protein LJR118_003858 [Acidovorax sp. LjRoot118]|uniref:hypothetical protein n=1 Tax=Acidovorax sp. LjRoot118 TaxID=3342256 RepID=UPI003ECEDC91